jgi:hypothetical protein
VSPETEGRRKLQAIFGKADAQKLLCTTIGDLRGFGKGLIHGFTLFLRFSIQTSIIWLDNESLDEFFTYLEVGVGEARSSAACRRWSIGKPACMASRINTGVDVLSSSTASSSDSSSSAPVAQNRDQDPSSTPVAVARP